MTPEAKNSGATGGASANYIHPYLLGAGNTLVELDDGQADRLLALGASLKRVSPEEERKHWIARAAQLATEKERKYWIARMPRVSPEEERKHWIARAAQLVATAKPAAAGEKKAAEALTAYEQGFVDKCAELGVDPAVLVKAAAGTGAAAQVPATDLQRYLDQYRATDAEPVTNPLKHTAIGGVAGASLGAVLAAALARRGDAAVGGAALGGLAGLGAGTLSGGALAVRDILRQRRRKRALYRAFAEAHGLDPDKQIYMHAPGIGNGR